MARGRAKQETDAAGNPVDTQPEFASVEGSHAERVGTDRVRPVKRARFGVVVLTVLVVEILLIGAGVNQGVAKHLESYSGDHPSSLLGHFMRSLLVLRWQVSASGHSDLWHTELITVGLVLLLGIVLVPMVVHGPVSWLRAFVGTWFTVTVSVAVSAVAAIVLADLEESRDLAQYVIPGTPSTGLSIGDKISDATFGPVLSYAFVAGLALGLVVALITATVVVSMRRTDPVPVAVAADPDPAYNPETPQPFFGNSVEDDRPTRASAGDTRRLAGSDSYASAGSYADSHPYAAPDRRASEQTTTLPAVGPDTEARPPATSPADAPAGTATGTSAGEADDRSGERLSGYDRALGASPADSTTALPRVGTERPPTRAATTPPPATPPAQAEPEQATQAWPAQPAPEPDATPAPDAPESGSTTDAQSTAAFPLPPDDEDLGHHPDHQDD